MTVKWYVDAIGDLDRIYDFYVKKNPRAAAMLYNKILDSYPVILKPALLKSSQ